MPSAGAQTRKKAAMAAILHDSAKELPKQELLQIFADNAIIAENAPARPLPVWHGIAAAILAETQWGITDPEILLLSAAILPASRECPSSIRSSIWPI